MRTKISYAELPISNARIEAENKARSQFLKERAPGGWILRFPSNSNRVQLGSSYPFSSARWLRLPNGLIRGRQKPMPPGLGPTTTASPAGWGGTSPSLHRSTSDPAYLGQLNVCLAYFARIINSSRCCCQTFRQSGTEPSTFLRANLQSGPVFR